MDPNYGLDRITDWTELNFRQMGLGLKNARIVNYIRLWQSGHGLRIGPN